MKRSSSKHKMDDQHSELYEEIIVNGNSTIPQDTMLQDNVAYGQVKL